MPVKRRGFRRFNGFITDSVARRVIVLFVCIGISAAIIRVMVKTQKIDPAGVGFVTALCGWSYWIMRPKKEGVK